MYKMPTLFISHGPPAILKLDCPANRFFQNIASHIPKPKAIVCISAHWEALFPIVTSAAAPETIHDFSGPAALFQLKYSAPGSPALAQKIVDLLNKNGFKAKPDPARGLDHGTWVPLLLMYPEHDIPVLQISVETEEDARYHYKLGLSLCSLRDQGVLIISSGGAVHNLDEIHNYSMNSEPPKYVTAFDEWLEYSITHGNLDTLLNYKKEAPQPDRCHPYPAEHFLPLFVSLGTAQGKHGRQIHKSFLYGTLSMASYLWS